MGIYANKSLVRLIVVSIALLAGNIHVASSRDYAFDGSITETALRNYLARSITFCELLNPELTEESLGGNVDDNIRMLTNIGAKFIGRSIYMWGDETRIDTLLESGETVAEKIHRADPDIVLQAAAFEIVTEEVDKIPIPAWVFEIYDLQPETRNFRYQAMLYPDGHRKDQWRRGSSVPDMSQLETRLWFLFLTGSYINIGVEAIHFGQVEIMDDRDPNWDHWQDMMTRVRDYAAKRARRHFVICDAHTPGGGIVRGGKLLFDCHSFPLRIEEVADKPEQGILLMGHYDSLFGRSKGGETPSGWTCDHLPYLVEFDNFGRSRREGQNIGEHWIWGYDEIGWYARQSEAYRDLWLHYAWNWLKLHDPDGYLEMPGSRTLAFPADGKHWYWANTPSDAIPSGYNQENTIKAIWATDID